MCVCVCVCVCASEHVPGCACIIQGNVALDGVGVKLQ